MRADVTDTPAWDHTLARSPYDDLYGLQLVAGDDGGIEGRLAITREHHQPTGVVHGGVYAAIGEAVASQAANLEIAAHGRVALGMTNTTSFMRPASAGTLHARPEVLHRGLTTWLVDVRIRDDAERLCAVSRVTLAIRPRPQPPP